MANFLKKIFKNEKEIKDSVDSILGIAERDESIIELDNIPEIAPTFIDEKNSDEQENQAILSLSKTGYELIKSKLYFDAIDTFNKILEIEPKNNYALIGIGDAERKRGNFDVALNYYKQCYVNHPENNYAHFGIAECYKRMNKYTKAIEFWGKYLEKDPENITILTSIADAHRKIKNFDSSKSTYLKVLVLEPSNKYALIGLGHLYFDNKEYDKALTFWEKTLTINDDNLDVRIWTSLGNCHRKLKTFEKGLECFNKALEIDKNNFFALFGVADCYRGLGNHKKSYEYWKRILDFDPKNKVILTRIGDTSRNLKKYDEAEKFYNAALNIEFDNYAILGLALIEKEKGNFEKAVEILQKAKRYKPKNYRLYTEIADCYIHLNRKEEALEILQSFSNTGMKSTFVDDMIFKLLKK